MKKFAVLVAIVALFAVAAPVFAATNPFMDVPMNSWAYDAVASLAAKGILSGYPDGLYRGKQAMTRYEAASAIARALAYIDMTKADKQDVEMLKKLVVEFKDELDALGVRVDALEADFGVMKGRLGGWRISGQFRNDVQHRTVEDRFVVGGVNQDYKELGVWNSRARLIFEKWFGENEDTYFNARINSGAMQGNDGALVWRRFFFRMPVFSGAQLTVGRFSWEMENFFNYQDPTGRYGTWAWFSDTEVDGIGFTKDLGVGSFRMFLANNGQNPNTDTGVQLTAAFTFNMNENFSAILGGQYIRAESDFNNFRDNYEWSSVFTGWVGVNAGFMNGLSLMGAVYFQSVSETGNWATVDVNGNNASGGTAYRIGLNVSQEVLKFTSFYAEYSKVPTGFYMRNTTGGLSVVLDDAFGDDAGNLFAGRIVQAGLKALRFGANQKWNDKWGTWLFWERLALDDFVDTINGYGVGVVYQYTPTTTFGLNYMGINSDTFTNVNRIRFTTEINF